jgi:hypothetical protein
VAEPEFEKTPKKAGRWFRSFIFFALLYGITFSLHFVFNWIFFFAAAYSFFMSYFLLPVQPRIFQARPSSRGPQFDRGARATQAQSAPNVQTTRARKVILIVAFVIFGMFMIPFTIGFIEGLRGEDSTDDPFSDEQSTESNDTDAMNYVDKGNEFFNNQQYDSATAYYEKALAIDSNYGAAIYGKGIVAYNNGRIDEANRYFLQAYDQGYRYAWLSWALADMYDKQGQTVRAMDFYKESVGLDSSYTDSYRRLAELEPANSQKYLDLVQKHTSN